MKLDQIFVASIIENPYDKKVIEGIIALTNHLNIEVIAEGVEYLEQFNCLKGNHVDLLQGYYISVPLEAQLCTLLLTKRNYMILS